jgi:CRP/FNR family cyclic AMP-dependent transcriptional regulator
MTPKHELPVERLIQEHARSWPAASFLARLDRDVLSALVIGRRVTHFAAGAHLMVEDDPAAEVFLLVSGLVKVTARLSQGSALLAVRVGGDLLGEIAVADGGARSATVTAVGRGGAAAIAIPGQDFTSAMDRYPAAARLHAATLTRKLRAANRRRVDFTACQVPVRLARLLAEMAQDYGKAADHPKGVITLRVGLGQAELATLIGAGEASVSDALRDLRCRGILAWGYREVHITDLAALRAAGQLPPNGPAPGEIP